MPPRQRCASVWQWLAFAILAGVGVYLLADIALLDAAHPVAAPSSLPHTGGVAYGDKGWTPVLDVGGADPPVLHNNDDTGVDGKNTSAVLHKVGTSPRQELATTTMTRTTSHNGSGTTTQQHVPTPLRTTRKRPKLAPIRLTPWRHNVVITVTPSVDYMFLPPLVSATWKAIGVRTYVLLYGFKPAMLEFLAEWIFTMGGVPIPMEISDSPVLPTTGRQLPAVQFAKLVRLAGACAVSQGLYRAYGYEVEWGPHSVLWTADADQIMLNPSYMMANLSAAPLHVWNGRCCIHQQESPPAGWQPMLPMGYIGATVDVLRDVFGPMPKRMHRCRTASVLAKLIQRNAAHVPATHPNLDQITALARVSSFCEARSQTTAIDDMAAHSTGNEACVQTRRAPVRFNRKLPRVKWPTRYDDVHLPRAVHATDNWPAVRELVSQFLTHSYGLAAGATSGRLLSTAAPVLTPVGRRKEGAGMHHFMSHEAQHGDRDQPASSVTSVPAQPKRVTPPKLRVRVQRSMSLLSQFREEFCNFPLLRDTLRRNTKTRC